jgi:phosphatidylserine/phosphatidylglycerophosphate/cardiolipin synthase-like enzyme
MAEEVVFSRTTPVAEMVERLLGAASVSIAAALYRLNSPRLGRALEDALSRGAQVRLLLDCNKYRESGVTRDWVTNRRVPVRLLYGRRGQGSKMHHKFVILDGQTVLTGSYNWTLESEEQNYESLLILRDTYVVESYGKEFEALWLQATEQ